MITKFLLLVAAGQLIFGRVFQYNHKKLILSIFHLMEFYHLFSMEKKKLNRYYMENPMGRWE